MTRDFLESLGCESLCFEPILTEHERELSEHRKQIEVLNAALTAAEESVASLTAEKSAGDRFREQIVTHLVREAHPTSQLAEQAACQQLKEAIARGEDPYMTLESIRSEDPNAFSTEPDGLPVFAMADTPEDPGAFSGLSARRW